MKIEGLCVGGSGVSVGVKYSNAFFSHLIMKTSILRDLLRFSFPSVPLILKGVYSPLSATYLSNPFVIFSNHTLRCWVSFLIVIFSPSRTHGDTSL